MPTTTAALTIRNLSKKEQYIIFEGERIALGAHEVRIVAPDVAQAFIAVCKPNVILEQSVNSIDETGVAPDDTVWLFNATGNPDAPRTIKHKVHRKGTGWTEEDMDNPKATPFTVKHEIAGGQVPGKLGSEDTLLNMAPQNHTILPYSRKRFTKDTAAKLLLLDSMQEPFMRGCIKVARPMGSFEPNETWSLDKLQLYAHTIDSAFKVGKTEAQLKDMHDKGKLGLKSFETVLMDEKIELMKRLFFYIADPDHRIPTEEEWNNVLAGQEVKGKGKDKKSGFDVQLDV